MALGPRDLSPQFSYALYSETEELVRLIDEALWRTQNDFGNGPITLTLRVLSPSLLVKDAVAPRFLSVGWRTFIWTADNKILLTK